MEDNYYDAIAESYNELYGEEQVKKLSILLDNLPIPKEAKLLDVGCGTGIATDLIDCNKTGIDPSKKLIEKANFKTKKASAENIPFEDKKYDYVTSFTAIHNFEYIDKAMEEMARVLKDEGMLIVSVYKTSKLYDAISEKLCKKFVLKKIIDAGKDTIFIMKKFL